MTCKICAYDDVMFYETEFSTCDENISHESICLQCHFNYIKTKIHLSPDTIPCIICRKHIQEVELLQFLELNEELKSKREKILIHKVLKESNIKVVKCCQCENMIEFDEEDEYIICPNHEDPVITCIRHEIEWHVGETCNEYDARMSVKKKEEEKKSEEVIKQYKKCPHCNLPYFKEEEEQCDRLICAACDYIFCGKCGADYNLIIENDNSFHDENCPFHTNNLKT